MLILDLFLAGVGLGLAVFHKREARRAYPQQLRWGFQGSLRMLEVIFLLGGAGMFTISTVFLLMELLG